MKVRKSPTHSLHSRKISGGPQYSPVSDRLSRNSSPQSQMPSTPPLPGTSSFDHPPRGLPSPGSPSTNLSIQTGYFPVSPSNKALKSSLHGRSTYPPLPDAMQWTSTNSPNLPREASVETSRSGNRSPPRQAYPDPSEHDAPFTGLAQQRSLPEDFPPAMQPSTHNHPSFDPQIVSSPSNRFPGHHQSPHAMSIQHSYQQSTDRYICGTCQKAFSRPSSLKIHGYSHTGEKPFQCKYDGCGKHFSVRSNMKRHEKGCHAGDSSSTRADSPATSVS